MRKYACRYTVMTMIRRTVRVSVIMFHVTDLADGHVKALDFLVRNNESLTVNLGSEKRPVRARAAQRSAKNFRSGDSVRKL